MVGIAVTDAALHEKTADFDFFDYEADEIEYLTRWGPGLLRLGAVMSFGGYCVSRPGLLRLGTVVG